MTPSRGGPADLWRAGLILFVFALSLPVGYAGPLGFAALVPVGGLLGLPVLRVRRQSGWLIAPLLLLVLWAAVSTAWSPAATDLAAVDDYADLESVTALKLLLQLPVAAALVLAADALSPRAARLATAVLAFAVVTLTVALFAEALTGAGFYRAIRDGLDDPIRPDLAFRNVGQGTFVVAVLFWPAAIGLTRLTGRGGVLVGLAALMLTMAALMFGAYAPALALVAGLVAYVLTSSAPRVGPLLLSLATIAFTLAAPLILGALRAPPGIPLSWTARLDIWTFASARVLERPWFGWGLDASRTFGPAVPLHPHDAALQLWLELGVIGAALAAVFWAAVFWFAGVRAEDDRPVGGAWAATAAAYLTLGALSFGVWQEWWLALGAVAFAAALALARGWPRPASEASGPALRPLG